MNNMKYSVLMSVYYKEEPDYLRKAMLSIFNQTVPTNDFVLICDGPLNEKLDNVISYMEEKHKDILHVIRLKENGGLGNALNIGIKNCKNEIVARMDSDDISIKDRCQKELEIFEKYPEVSIVSGTVLEFEENVENIVGKRKLPEFHKDICKYSRKRSPFNHPAVMFRKSIIESVGGYRSDYPFLEDYDLWIRILQGGYIGYNLREPVLYMRVSLDLYLRRGGRKYAETMLGFHRWLKEIQWTNRGDYLTGALPHALVCVLPNSVRGRIYQLIH